MTSRMDRSDSHITIPFCREIVLIFSFPNEHSEFAPPLPESSCGELLWRGARSRGAATPRGRGRPWCILRKKRIRRKVGPEAVLKGCPRAEAAQGAEIQLLLKCAYHRRGGPNMSRTCMYLATERSKVEKRDHLEHRISRKSGKVPGKAPASRALPRLLAGAATPRGGEAARGAECGKSAFVAKWAPEAVLKGGPRAKAAQGAEIQLLLKCACHRRGGPNMSRTCMYLATECSKVEKRDHLEHRILRKSGRVPGNTPPLPPVQWSPGPPPGPPPLAQPPRGRETWKRKRGGIWPYIYYMCKREPGFHFLFPRKGFG